MPGEDGDPEPTSSRSAIVVVVGLMIGLVAGTLVAWTLRGDSQPVSMFQNDEQGSVPLPETEEAAEAFMAAWERSRRAEHIVVSEWHRSTTAGASVTETRVFAQRLPDRIRSGAHNRGGRVGNVVYTCDRLPITAEQLEAGDATPEVECRSNELDPETAAELDPADVSGPGWHLQTLVILTRSLTVDLLQAAGLSASEASHLLAPDD